MFIQKKSFSTVPVFSLKQIFKANFDEKDGFLNEKCYKIIKSFGLIHEKVPISSYSEMMIYINILSTNDQRKKNLDFLGKIRV